MGLAPYGEPRFVKLILDELVDVRDDGSLRLNMKYFNFAHGLTMTNDRFAQLFDAPPRAAESELTQREMDLARSVQEVTELAMLKMARHVRKETGERNLCLAGGVALNCVGNGRILREKIFDQLWIQPAAGDAGGALGAALSVWHNLVGGERDVAAMCGERTDGMRGSYLGDSFDNTDVQAFLETTGARFRRIETAELSAHVARLLAAEKVVGWFQGRMEFGPRALGNRSILGDSRSPRMQSQMNLKIKYRESFRPFAPSVLRERVADYFDLDCDSPYMLLVAPVREDLHTPMTSEQEQLFGVEKLNIPRSFIPAVTHVDYSARIQTVSRADNERYYDLLAAFERLTGCAVLVNTSFNVRGEPIVHTPEDAFNCFMRTEMDALVIGNYVLDKSDLGDVAFADDKTWQEEFQLD
jgi:carbamoyltransferase